MTTTQFQDWRSQGACLSADPDLFFPISVAGPGSAQVAEAKSVCRGCPVHRQCLDFALRNSRVHGIWGGTTEEDRVRMRRGGGPSALVPGPREPASGRS